VWRTLPIVRSELVLAGIALLFLLIGEAVMSAMVRGTHFAPVDGKIAEAVVRSAFRLVAPFDVTSLNHIQGVGSLLLPLKLWANPAYWPFSSSKTIELQRFRVSLRWFASQSPSM
jgi:hypothetical protein